MENGKSYNQLVDELNAMRVALEDTRFRLEEANDTIDAIRSGEIDALVVKGDNGHQLYTLKNADQTYRIFIEQMTEGAVTLNKQGMVLYSNSRFASLVKLPLEKVIGQDFCKFIITSAVDDCETLIEAAWESDLRGETFLTGEDDDNIPVLLSLKTLHLDEGLSMSVIITDLTSQKETNNLLENKNAELEEAQRITKYLNANLENTVAERTRELEINILQKTLAEQELRSNQERLKRILETMAEGVGIIDLEGNLTYANPMAQKILGLHYHEILNRTFYDSQWENLRVNGTPLPQEEHPMAVTMATGKPVYDYEIAVQPTDRERFYISINAAPLHNETGKIIGGIGTFMDVTNRRMQQQQKDDFISIASHELKTPITSLKASLQLLNRLKSNPTSNKIPGLIDQANKSVEKVSALISELLNVSNMSDGQLHLNKKLFLVSELINDCCNHIRTEGIYSIITEGDHEIRLFADKEKVEQVVVNFVNNAVKYAPHSKEIRIRVETTIDDMVKITVADSGPGISADKLPYLFDRYYRVESNGIRYSGLGLGLYISAEIIKKHGGQIGVDSELGKGSSFWFTLPKSSDMTEN